MRGYKEEEALILLSPRKGEAVLRTEDILAVIREHGESIALIMLPGVQFYTGQFFDCSTLAKAAHQIVPCRPTHWAPTHPRAHFLGCLHWT